MFFSSEELNAIRRPQALLCSCRKDQVAAPYERAQSFAHVCVCVCEQSVLSMLHSHLHDMSKYSQKFGCLSELMGQETIKRCVPVVSLLLTSSTLLAANRSLSSCLSDPHRQRRTPQYLHHALQ